MIDDARVSEIESRVATISSQYMGAFHGRGQPDASVGDLRDEVGAMLNEVGAELDAAQGEVQRLQDLKTKVGAAHSDLGELLSRGYRSDRRPLTAKREAAAPGAHRHYK